MAINLGRWFRDRKKQAEGVVAQANPFDGGKTYNTVINNTPVAKPVQTQVNTAQPGWSVRTQPTQPSWLQKQNDFNTSLSAITAPKPQVAQTPTTFNVAQQPVSKPVAQQPVSKPVAQQPVSKPVAQQPQNNVAKPASQFSDHNKWQIQRLNETTPMVLRDRNKAIADKYNAINNPNKSAANTNIREQFYRDSDNDNLDRILGGRKFNTREEAFKVYQQGLVEQGLGDKLKQANALVSQHNQRLSQSRNITGDPLAPQTMGTYMNNMDVLRMVDPRALQALERRLDSDKATARSGINQILNNSASGATQTFAKLPVNAANLGWSLVDTVTPEGSKIDKFAERIKGDAQARAQAIENAYARTGVSQQAGDNPFIAVPASGAGQIASAIATGGTVSGVGVGTDIVSQTQRDMAAHGEYDETKQLLTALPNAVAQGLLEKYGVDNLATPAGKSFLKSVLFKAASEGAQEGSQEFAGNIAKNTYDKSQGLLDNVLESAGWGTLLGGGTGLALDSPRLATEALEIKRRGGPDLVSGSRSDINETAGATIENFQNTQPEFNRITTAPVNQLPDAPSMVARIRAAKERVLNPVPMNEGGKAMSVDPLESLKQEARKYKSADEFVNSQSDTYQPKTRVNKQSGNKFVTYETTASDGTRQNVVFKISKDGKKTVQTEYIDVNGEVTGVTNLGSYEKAAQKYGTKDPGEIALRATSGEVKAYDRAGNPVWTVDGELGDTKQLTDLYNQATAPQVGKTDLTPQQEMNTINKKAMTRGDKLTISEEKRMAELQKQINDEVATPEPRVKTSESRPTQASKYAKPNIMAKEIEVGDNLTVRDYGSELDVYNRKPATETTGKVVKIERNKEGESIYGGKVGGAVTYIPEGQTTLVHLQMPNGEIKVVKASEMGRTVWLGKDMDKGFAPENTPANSKQVNALSEEATKEINNIRTTADLLQNGKLTEEQTKRIAELQSTPPQVGKTDPLESLKQEALKYKSADEFTQAIQDGKVSIPKGSPEQIAAIQKQLGMNWDEAYKTPTGVYDMQKKVANDLYNQATQPPKSTPAPKAPKPVEKTPTYYHGTRADNDFDKFDFKKSGTSIAGDYGNNVHQGNVAYFTKNKDSASIFAREATDRYDMGVDFESFIKRKTHIKDGNVLEFKPAKDAKIKKLDHRPDLAETNKLKQQGYDGVEFDDKEAWTGFSEGRWRVPEDTTTVAVWNTDKLERVKATQPPKSTQAKPPTPNESTKRPIKPAPAKPLSVVDRVNSINETPKAPTKDNYKKLLQEIDDRQAELLRYPEGARALENKPSPKMSKAERESLHASAPVGTERKLKVATPVANKNIPVRKLTQEGDVVTATNVNPNIKATEKRFSIDDDGQMIEDRKGAYRIFNDGEGKITGIRIGKEYHSAKELGDLSDVNDYGSSLATMRRNIERAFGKETGDKLSKFVVDHQQKQATKLIRRQLELKQGTDALAKELGISFGIGRRRAKKVSASIQDYGEGNITRQDLVSQYGENMAGKIVEADKWFKSQYNQLLDEMNKTLTTYGYDPVQKHKNYYTHFQDQSLWSKVGLKMQEIRSLSSPTMQDSMPAPIRGSIDNRLAGQSEFMTPNKRFNPFALQRKGDAHTSDAFQSFERYLTPALNNIYMTPSITRARVVSQAIAEQANLAGKDANGVIRQTREWANRLAGKTSRIDRTLVDSKWGNTALRASQWAQRKAGANTIVGNLSTAVMQPVVLTQTIGKFGLKNTLLATVQEMSTAHSKFAPIRKSEFMTRRYADLAPTTSGKIDRAAVIANTPLEVVEETASRITWNAAHNDALSKGIRGKDAIHAADVQTEKTIAGRSIGERPELFDAKHPD